MSSIFTSLVLFMPDTLSFPNNMVQQEKVEEDKYIRAHEEELKEAKAKAEAEAAETKKKEQNKQSGIFRETLYD